MAEIQVYLTNEELARGAAERIAAAAGQAIARRGRFSLALAGGSTPRLAYQRLAEMGETLDWLHIHLFWGDERCVPPDHPESNYHMAKLALIDTVPIPLANLHRIPGELPAWQAAQRYNERLEDCFGPASPGDSAEPGRPVPAAGAATFDLALLGLGEDGHTASLFPGSTALQVAGRWATAVEHRTPPPPLVDRVSLTLPALNACRQVLFIVAGEQKAAILKQVLSPPADAPPLPAQQIHPQDGVLWLADAAAASLL